MSEDIRKAQLAMSAKIDQLKKRAERATERVTRLRSTLSEAEADLMTANTELTTLEAKYNGFVQLFPLELTEETPKAQTPRVVADSGNKLPPIIDSIRLVMGDLVMTAPQIEAALRERKLDRKSNNLRGYISTLLSSNEQDVIGPDGQKVMVDGKVATYKTFICVERGHYRVAPIPTSAGSTDDDIVESKTTAEDLLASQGVDIKSLTSTLS